MRNAFALLLAAATLGAAPVLAQPPSGEAPAEAAKAEEAGVDLPAKVSLTNAVEGERPKPPAPDREKIQGAIVQGDPKLALALGGSPMELGQALLNRPETGEGMKRRLSTATSAVLVNVGGQVGLEIQYVEGGRPAAAVVVSRAFEGVTPTADMRVLDGLPRPPAP